MKIRLYLSCAHKVRPMLEMTPLPECQQSSAAAALTKRKLIHNFFGWWCHYLHVPRPPYVTFCHYFWVPLSPPTLVTSFLNGPSLKRLEVIWSSAIWSCQHYSSASVFSPEVSCSNKNATDISCDYLPPYCTLFSPMFNRFVVPFC